MEFNIKTFREANDYRARIKKFIVDTDNLRDNLFLFVTDDSNGVLYGNAKCAEQINSLLKEFDLNEVLAAKRIIKDKKFEDYKVAHIKWLPTFAVWESTDEELERYTECFQKEYEGDVWEKFDNKTVDDSEGIIEYSYISIYDFRDGYDYKEKAFLNALSYLNLVLLHPGRNMFNY